MTRTSPPIRSSVHRCRSPATRNDDVYDDAGDDSGDDGASDNNNGDDDNNDDDSNIVAGVARCRSCPRCAGVAPGRTSRDRHRSSPPR